MSRLKTLPLLLFALLIHATLEAAPPDRVDLLIRFANPPAAEDLRFLRAQGADISHSYKIVPAVAVSMPSQAVQALSNNKNILLIEEDITVQAIGEYENAWGIPQIGANEAHTVPVIGTGVKVAVIDSGIDYSHLELTGVYKGGWDFVNNDADPADDNSHGTHCSGTIAAALNGVGVVGVAYGVELYGLKVLNASGSGSFSNIIAALDWCVDNGIQVTNNSYGSSQNPGLIVEEAFINAEAAGILNIAAAGNSGSPRGKGDNVGYPAAYNSVVAVAATDRDNIRAYFSSTGPAVEISAPGLGIDSTIPGGGYATYSGTSMACPHAVGAAALFIEYGGLNNRSTRQLLSLSATDLGAAGPDSQYGAGLVNVPAGLLLIDQGFGSGNPPGNTMSVVGIDYSISGGRTKDRDLNIAVTIQDESQNPVSGAAVRIEGFYNGGSFGTSTSTTGTNGVAVFVVQRAPSGHYDTEVLSVTATGMVWDGIPFTDSGYDK